MADLLCHTTTHKNWTTTRDDQNQMLYGLIHARYLLTSRGMNAIAEKIQTAQFGRCPRVLCQGQAVLPVGRSDLPRNYTVNVYCPMCQVRRR